MPYHIDLEQISLDEYRLKLGKAYLPPSRMLLKERLDERFSVFKALGIKNLKELVSVLKKKNQQAKLLQAQCLNEEYLVILLRELNSLLPKPNKLEDFPGLAEETTELLAKLGIKNTQKLYDRVLTAELRKQLAEESGLSPKTILELTSLTDLSRIKWVGALYARILYDLGITSVEVVAKTDPVELHKRLNELNAEKNYFRGNVGLNDIRILVETAAEVPADIRF